VHVAGGEDETLDPSRKSLMSSKITTRFPLPEPATRLKLVGKLVPIKPSTVGGWERSIKEGGCKWQNRKG